MNTRIRHETNILSRKLHLFVPETQNELSKEILQENQRWHPVNLLYKIFSSCSLKLVLTSISDLQELISNFKKEFNINVSLKLLLEKHWLRVILGNIEMAGTIGYACTTFSELKEDLNELKFLITISGKDNEKISVEDFEDQKKKYENENNVLLNISPTFKAKYLHPTSDGIAIANPIYYQPFVEYYNEFLFLDWLKVRLENRYRATIDKAILNKIYQEHKVEFPLTPSLDKVIEGFHSTNENEYSIFFDEYWNEFGNQVLTLFLTSSESNIPIPRMDKFLAIFFSQGWLHNNNIIIPRVNVLPVLDYFQMLLLNAEDLLGAEQEEDKAIIDDNLDRNVAKIDPRNRRSSFVVLHENDTVYERYYKLERIDDEYQNNLFTIQSARQDISKLIRFLVCHDDYFGQSDFPFSKRLLATGIEKPFLLWETCDSILRDRRDIIAHIISELPLAPLGLYLSSKLEIRDCLVSSLGDVTLNKEERFAQLWDEAFQLFCNTHAGELQFPRPIADNIINNLFEALLIIFRMKFYQNGKYEYQKRLATTKKLSASLSAVEKLIYESKQADKIIEGLLAKVNRFDENNLQSGIFTIPLIKMEVLMWFPIWLDKFHTKSNDLRSKCYKAFTGLFTEVFYDTNFAEGEKNVWLGNKNIDKLPWGDIIKLLDKEKALQDLFKIHKLTLSENLSKYNNGHDIGIVYLVNRSRTYLQIILVAHNQMVAIQDSSLFFSLEKHLHDYIEEFSLDNYMDASCGERA